MSQFPIIVILLVLSLATGCSQDGLDGNKASLPKSPLLLNLGEGVRLEFVWIPDLKLWVGRFEVTNQEYKRFNPEHNSGCYPTEWLINEDYELRLDAPRQPVVRVGYSDALSFISWINKNCADQLPPAFTARLPERKEWINFAQCGQGRKYPWGNDWPPPPEYNYFGMESAGVFHSGTGPLTDHTDKYIASAPVEESGRNEWGLCGVGGNVFEWTKTPRSASHTQHTLVGCGYMNNLPGLMRCKARLYSPDDTGTHGFGFRLVLSR